jgi:hypothetical protein
MKLIKSVQKYEDKKEQKSVYMIKLHVYLEISQHNLFVQLIHTNIYLSCKTSIEAEMAIVKNWLSI